MQDPLGEEGKSWGWGEEGRPGTELNIVTGQAEEAAAPITPATSPPSYDPAPDTEAMAE